MAIKSFIYNPVQTRHTSIVLRSAIASRLILITLIILWRSLFSPYDTSASINPNCLSSNTTTNHPIRFPHIASSIEDGIVWDSVYFVRIAQCGYEYERSYAFLPLLPICISLLSRTVFEPLIPLIGHRAVLGLSGYVLNNTAFVFAALCLYRLSLIILKDPDSALRASILFCFNPASTFYSSIYSESLYSLLSIGGLYYLMSDELRAWCKARLPLLYNYIQSHYWGMGLLRYFQLKQLPNFLLASPILSLVLCSIIHYVKLQPEIFFSLGFLASPEDKTSSAVLISSGVDARSNSTYFSGKLSSKIQRAEDQVLRRRKKSTKGVDPITSPLENNSSYKPKHSSILLLPFVLHLGFMAATAFFVMHVQVSTRFLSASPPLYWYASYLVVSPCNGKRWGHLIWAYCAAYILIGSLLFSNFYPFT
ncbi:uncharacterized protein LOC132271444 isoform X3 [Cornus florida]|uniref:uncharacterized protein LOC132271444 isoform X3 n=1 Tax=Cornus florida TaxID=4283 RepID=UPI002896DED3|nr:uncharacterized protein LOC132271444 isoform X3 [Cornus florida]